MSFDPIIVVTGLPRSGTTCMMRMLEAGGIPLYYDNDKPIEFTEGGTSFVNYNVILRETEKLNDLKAGNSKWLMDCRGKAVKILNPMQVIIPPGPAYRFIWMDRKTKHCVKSNRKFLKRNVRDSRMPHAQGGFRSLAESAGTQELMGWANRQKKCGLALLRGYPESDMVIVKFEDVLKNPRFAAKRVARFLKLELNLDAMAAVVVKRPAHCLTKMLEEEIYV